MRAIHPRAPLTRQSVPFCFVALRRCRREASPPHQLLNTTRGALRPRPGQLGLHLLRGHRLLHIWARGKRRQRFHTLLHPMGGALLFYSVPLGEIQHRHLVFALGIRRQPSGEEDNTHRASAMVAVKRNLEGSQSFWKKKSDLLGFVSFQTISLIYVITSVVGVETWYKPILFNFLYRDLFTLMIVGKRRLLPTLNLRRSRNWRHLFLSFSLLLHCDFAHEPLQCTEVSRSFSTLHLAVWVFCYPQRSELLLFSCSPERIAATRWNTTACTRPFCPSSLPSSSSSCLQFGQSFPHPTSWICSPGFSTSWWAQPSPTSR